MIKTRVLATGVFDVLHPGHIHYLEASRKLGNELMVLIAHDDYVRATKGEPIFSMEQRKHLVSSLKCVDQVIIPEYRNQDDFYKTVLEIGPTIITLGFNQKFDVSDLQRQFAAHGWQGRIVRIDAYPQGDISSSHVKQKIKQHG